MGSDKNTRKHHIQESQEVSPSQHVTTRLQGTDKDIMTDMKHINIKDSRKKHRLGTVSKILLGGLNMFDSSNLTLISDVDQDK